MRARPSTVRTPDDIAPPADDAVSTHSTLAAGRVRFDDAGAVQEHFHSHGWTDGLPIVPPTGEAVEACLDWALLAPDELIGVEPVHRRAITAEKVAINAVMAGCLPMHFPVVVTAVTANGVRPVRLAP